VGKRSEGRSDKKKKFARKKEGSVSVRVGRAYSVRLLNPTSGGGHVGKFREVLLEATKEKKRWPENKTWESPRGRS